MAYEHVRDRLERSRYDSDRYECMYICLIKLFSVHELSSINHRVVIIQQKHFCVADEVELNAITIHTIPVIDLVIYSVSYVDNE